MNLYRLHIVPESPCAHALAVRHAGRVALLGVHRSEGDAVLRREIVDPALEGRPPFVLSDAFPDDRLPVPMVVRLTDWPAADRKTVKHHHWLPEEAFGRVQGGGRAGLLDLNSAAGVHEYVQLRNTIGRDSNTTAREGGLFPTDEAVLDHGVEFLSVYARIQEGFADFFWRLLQELAGWGFGADRSAGKGQFRLEGQLESADANWTARQTRAAASSFRRSSPPWTTRRTEHGRRSRSTASSAPISAWKTSSSVR